MQNWSLMAAKAPLYPLASVDNALELLVLLSRAPLRLTEAATVLGVAPSTAHRLLAMLEHRGFARRGTGTRSYMAGPTLSAVARDVLGEVGLARLAQPVLEELGRAFHETVFLAVLDDAGTRFVAGHESELPLRVGGHLNQSFAAHATASGLVLLAALTRAELRARYPAERLLSVQPETIGQRSALERELDAVRARGYAVSIETNAPGVNAVAVPLADIDGNTIAALTLVAPSSRFDLAKLRACVAPLRRAASRLGRDYTPAP
jgi:DNA-binding IclR family transcriptional regulator